MTATRKIRNGRSTSSTSSTPRLDSGEIAHVGVDVHKASYHVAVVTDLRGLVATWTQPADPGLLVARLDPIRVQVAQVVYEAGPTGFALVRRLRASGYSAEVIAPSKIPAMPGPESKSDRLDCRKLAVFAQKGLLRSVRVPTEQEEADRQVVRLREQLTRKLRVIQQQIKGLLLQHGIAEPAGLAHWSETAVEALRHLEVIAELRFCLDVMLDERQHALEQVALRHATPGGADQGRPSPPDGRDVADGPRGGADHGDDLPGRAPRAGEVRRRRPGGPDTGPGAAGPAERPDPPRGPAPEVGQRPATDGPDRGGLEVGRRRRGGEGEVPPAGRLDGQRQEGHRGDRPPPGDPAVADEPQRRALSGGRIATTA